jgi:hypothetical protein
MSEDREELMAELRQIFDEGVSEEKSEDEIKLLMIQAGESFSSVTRTFNQFMVDSGLKMSKEDKEELLENAVGNADDITSEEGFNDVVNEIVENGTNVNDKQAASWVRAYAKRNDMEVWSKPKGSGPGRTGFRELLLKALEANPHMTKEECEAFVQGSPDASEAAKANMGRWQRFRLMANRIVGAV